MRFRVLGPLQVWDGADWVSVPAARQRVVLAVLLAEAGRSVSTDRLVEELWGVSPPRRAAAAVQVYVGRLRRLLGGLDGGSGEVVVTRGSGYRLVLDDDGADGVDADVFEHLAADARKTLVRGELESAVGRFAQALVLWRGPALADVPACPTVTAHAARLDQARIGALEDRIGAQLGLGRHADVVDELGDLVREHPLRERMHAHYLLALYRCGRRADALAAYQAARRIMVGELGLEPGPELRGIEQAILTDDQQPVAAPIRLDTRGRPNVVPAQLPAEVADFTGRDTQLKQLDVLLDRNGDPYPVLLISAIAGAAGVGKTALAVHWGHQVRDRFPDGQLYVNLRGYADGPPVRPIEALAAFLVSQGVPATEVPVDEEQAAALYRSLLTDRRMLVLLDNARHADQVRPLLPSTAGCLVLVTSRDQMSGLVARDGATRLDLDVLSPDEAQILLMRLLSADRVTAEPEAARELAALCGYLPLAVRIAAANLLAHPGRTIAAHTAVLRAGDRLSALEVDGDAQAGVRAAFDHSYTSMPDEARRMFRLLGLAPGPDITGAAAAAVAGVTLPRADRLLDQLAGAYLVDEHVAGRYALHDLIRRYAVERAGAEDDGPAALDRLYAYYLAGVDSAARLLYPEMLRLPPAGASTRAAVSFADGTEAMAWLDAELPNLVATVTHAATHGAPAAAWRLADAMRGHLYLGMRVIDWSSVAQAGLAAALAEGDQYGQAAAHLSLAGLYTVTGDYRQAVDHYTPALELTRRAGWAAGQAAVLSNLGAQHWRQGRLDQAVEHYLQAQAIEELSGDPARQAPTVANLGLVYGARGQLDQAVEYLGRAVALYRQIGSRTGLAAVLADLGEDYHLLGRLDDAVDILTEARDLCQRGERYAQADSLRFLAAVQRDAGHHQLAVELATTALTFARDTADRVQEAKVLATLASIHDHAGEHQRAGRGYQQAVALARDIGNRYTEAMALIGLAATGRRTGPLDAARERAQAGLTIASHGRYRLLEGDAMTVLAAIHHHQGEAEPALDLARQALAVHRRTGYRLGQARAHVVAEHTLRRAGRTDEAETHRDRARALFDEIGVPAFEHERATVGR